MLDDRIGQSDPRMPPSFVHGDPRRRESRIGKGADGNRDQVRLYAQRPIDGRAAGWAEAEGDGIAAVGDAHELDRAPLDADLLAWEARVGAEDAAGPPLAVQAVADRNADGLARAGEPKLPAAAGRLACGHALPPSDFRLGGAENGRKRHGDIIEKPG